MLSRGGALRAASLRSLIERDGGFTLGCLDGLVPSSGISVCTRPSRSFAFAWRDWDDVAVDRWLTERSGEFGRRSRCLGGWLDPRSGLVWLDVVRVVPQRLGAAACLMGIALQQHCVFDLGRGETVVLRGRVA